MPAASRVTDLWTGICCCHSSPTCIPMMGFIITGSIDAVSTGLGQARVGDMTIGYCGHPGIIVTGSPSHITNALGSARLGEIVTGCNIGTLITGNPTHTIG